MFNNMQADIFIPDHVAAQASLARTTHLAVAAHQDDIEVMAVDGVLQCYENPRAHFSGVVMTDGKSSPRTGIYSDQSDEEMMQIRATEQRRAAVVGQYATLISLAYASEAVKDKANQAPTEDLIQVFKLTKPSVVYTHNLADKHPTHVAVAVRVILAIRQLLPENRPQQLLGCEVWRDLDWLPDEMKILLDCSTHKDLQQTLLGVFDSQIRSGKRYDRAAMGRRAAHATFHQPHQVDQATHMTYALDLTPLIENDALDMVEFINEKIQKFQEEVSDLLRGFV